MANEQRVQLSTQGAGPALLQLEKLETLNTHSKLWTGKRVMFLKVQPKVLGVVQIMVGLVNLSVGVVMSQASLHPVTENSLLSYRSVGPMSVDAWYTIWGSIMFICSGSFTLAAGIKVVRRLVQVSVGLNITSAVFAIVGITISSFSLFLSSCPYSECSLMRTVFLGLDGIVLTLSVLELFIAVVLSHFGCRITCCEVMLVVSSDPHTTQTAPFAQREEV
ncbi:PREDICTED: membrane-spanning 4-domains subfamily A member 4A-like [Chinchilla lanigera]|uniref:Membrane-spanning 4-domains subfamily A member 4A-like n=1 Tax=Chinchilla lanigera TaxID=34839 RepID=A0A8C2US86_CHILA|nr:PREDICTED: membrane-spanning 4-domains subfamily A member 4A-like [Chinchilla lanigera]XP_005408148.1 PREDICTED: membrane-spanning 4-domains subfamily A member 4A-like [Chinchilla lanigera]